MTWTGDELLKGKKATLTKVYPISSAQENPQAALPHRSGMWMCVVVCDLTRIHQLIYQDIVACELVSVDLLW